MKKLTIPLALILFLTLPACSEGFLYAEIPGMAVESPSPTQPTPTPILLPSAAPRVSTFGLPMSPVERFQPLEDNLRYNDQISRLCYDSLFVPGEKFEPVPSLCLSAVTEDNTAYTLFLRRGVTFHDGSPMTSADVIYSLELARLPGSPYAERLARVAGAAAIDETTMTLTLTAPTFNATALLDFPVIKQGSAQEQAAPGTGPYRVVLDAESPYLLAYDGWWKGAPPAPRRVELVEVLSADEMLYWFQAGYISVVSLDSRDTFAPGLRSGHETWDYPTGLMCYFGFNLRRAPLDNIEMRRVLALALDRQTLASEAYGKLAQPSALPVPPSSALFSQPEAARYSLDLPAAALALEGMGYYDTDGDGVLEREIPRKPPERLALTMIAASGNIWREKLAGGYADALRGLGFEVTLKLLGRADFDRALAAGDFDVYCAEASPLPSFSPAAFILPGGAFNKGGLNSPALNELMTALDAAAYGGRRAALDAVFCGIYDELPFLTVCFRSQSLCAQRGVVSVPTPVWGNAFNGWERWQLTVNN